MGKTLKPCQEKAVKSVSSKLLEKSIIKFQSPTGSGKTLMTAKIIENFLKNYHEDFFKKTAVIYISLSSGMLDHQGYKKITKLLNNKFVSGFTTEYIGTTSKSTSASIKTKNYIQGINEFKRNTVYFMGWGILTANSKAFKEGEEDNIFNVIRRTKASNTKILLIIDEAHRDNPMVESSKSVAKERMNFLNELAPDRQLWMSATFLSLKKPIQPDYVVSSEEAKADGLIKQGIIWNDFTDDPLDYSANKKLILDALNKRQQIIESIAKSKGTFNPLILIQIPDKTSKINNIDVNDYYLNMIEDVLQERGLRKTFDYGIYLSDIKTNAKEKIESLDSPLQVIVFKQAIATGWDVPRANILVKLRNPSSKTDSFEMQTLGRILRNPFLKVYKRGGNLTNQDVSNLNNGFIFTNDQNYSSFIKDEYDYMSLDSKDKLAKDMYRISKKARELPLNLKYLSIKEFEKKQWKIILGELLEKRSFIEKLFKGIERFYSDKPEAMRIFIKPTSIDSAAASDGIMKVNEQEQYEIDLGGKKRSDKKDLYYIYIEFMQTINGLNLIKEFVYNISKFELCNYSIKELYLYFIKNYDQVFEEEVTLKQKMNDIIYHLAKKFIQKEEQGAFTLLETLPFYKYNVNRIPSEYSQDTLINSYMMSIQTSRNDYKPIFDSLQEYFLYEWFKSYIWRDEEKKKLHLFRNSTNPSNSYYVEYLDVQSMKIRKFYPDFILTTENKVVIMEVKGLGKNDIDINSENKLSAISSDVSRMRSDKEILIFKIGSTTTPSKPQDLTCFQYVDGKKTKPIDLENLKEIILL